MGFVARELLGQSAAVLVTLNRGFGGKSLEGNHLVELGVGGRILEWV